MPTPFKIEVLSHGVRVSGLHLDITVQLKPFLEELTQRETEEIYDYRSDTTSYRTVIKKKYYVQTEDGKELFIHREHLDPFLEMLKTIGCTNYKLTHRKKYKPDEIEFKTIPTKVPRDYQQVIIDELVDENRTRNVCLSAGGGKALPLDTPVRIPNGFKPMGSIKVGDTVVAGNGDLTTVTDYFQEDNLEGMVITLEDGRQIKACVDHQFEVFEGASSKGKTYQDNWRVLTTKQMYESRSLRSRRLYLPVTGEDKSPDIKLPIAPYTLGALLGDGMLRNDTPILFCDYPHKQDIVERVLTENAGVVKRGVNVSPGACSLVSINPGEGNLLKRELITLGIMGLSSDEKFIPEVYFNGSYKQRLSLIQGLMDTDGDTTPPSKRGRNGELSTNSISFSTVSINLAKGLQRLIWSIGGICKLSHRQTYYTYKGERKPGKPSYRLNIRVRNPQELFYRSDRRDYTPKENQYSNNFKIRVKSIEYDTPFTGACISVDHPTKLYQAGDYIVTHNTFCALKATEILKSRVLLMLLPKYFGIWEKAIEEDVLEGVHCELIKGSKSLRDLIDRAINGDPIGDVIFMSVTTYRGYIECLERYGTKGIGELGYAVPPYRFHETLGIGLQINDEIQDDPGVYYRVDTVSHMNKEIFLTATPYTGSDKLTEMIRVMMNERYDVTIPVADKYTHVVGVRYNDLGVQKKDYRGYKNAYSHVNYESSILKNKPRKDKYFNNVARVVNHYFKGEYQKGQKMVIYCATQKFITALTKYLKKEFPEYTINEYVSGVDRNTLKANDITVTTIKSCGAGVDIPNLKEALMLVATNSKKDSIQAMRRPRPLINYEGINPRFSYFICNQIPKHLGYAKNKRTFFIPFALTHVDRRIG